MTDFVAYHDRTGQDHWPRIRAAIDAKWSTRANYFPDFGMPAFR